MAESERIAAINALCTLSRQSALERGIIAEDTRDDTTAIDTLINYLRALHTHGILNESALCVCLLGKHVEDLTEDEVAICEKAVQAMNEAIELEEGKDG